MKRELDRLARHYETLARRHGASAAANQWRDLETQERRFAVLADIAPDIVTASVLDFGCGTGALYGFLKEKLGFTGTYCGVDISTTSIEVARQTWPEARFERANLLAGDTVGKFDYVLISGVFNNRLHEDWPCMSYLQEVLQAVWPLARKGLAFNAMSTYVDYQDENLCYFSPEEIFAFCKTRLSAKVLLRHDYQIKDGVIPFEFAMYVYR